MKAPKITAGRLAALGLVLLAVALALVVVPSNEYLFLPDPAHATAPLVTVPGGHDPTRGGVFYVDVVVKKASLLEKLFGGLHKGADLYRASDVNPPCVDDAQRRSIDLQEMRRSQQTAAAVALRALGRRVEIRPTGARVAQVAPGMPAVCKLVPDDVIVGVDGSRVRDLAGVFAAMRKHRPGDVVRFTVRRGASTVVERIKTVAAPKQPGRAIVGIELEQAVDIHVPIDVRIDAGDVGGPSAGLAFALEVMEESGRDVVHGHRIAATGELFPNGAVGPIGGIKQKTIGARESGVDAFLVPAGDNAVEARKYAHGLRIIAVESFPQALHALATLR